MATGFIAADVQVFDVTDPVEVQTLPAIINDMGAGQFSGEVTPTGIGERTLLAVTGARTLQPAEIIPNQPSEWHLPSHRADLVILGHGSLLAAAEDLRDHRENQGLEVAMVDVEDVYDEFNFGMKSPYVVRDFVNHAATAWSAAPGYLLLLGDATLDPRNYRDAGRVDLMPTKMVPTAVFETASDDWFADIDGDGLANLAVGRLPVKSLERGHRGRRQAHRLRAGWSPGDLDPESLAGGRRLPGRGRRYHELRAGQHLARDAASRSLAIDRIFLGQDSEARSHLLDQLNEGRLLVNYLGHGSVESSPTSIGPIR